EQGMDPFLLDSNGVGGYHLWTLLDREYSLKAAYEFADALRSDWQDLNLPRKPEIFPPKPAVEKDDLPYGLRLPGRHHRRNYYSRVYNFDALESENEWLEGGEAIELMLGTRPAALPQTKKRATKSNGGPPKTKAKTPAVKRKQRICVDLDGVLAQYK